MRIAIAVLLLASATAAAAAESLPPGRSVAAAGYAYKPDPADYYPASSGVRKEQGITKIKLCYDLHGVPFEVTVVESSGFTRLDEAAVRYGKAVRIKPELVDGQPLTGCVTVPVRFAPKGSPEPPDQGEGLPSPQVQVPPIRTDIPLPRPPPSGRFIPLGGESTPHIAAGSTGS
jgi:TonB family protein